jgi:hypothetical protein
MVSIYSVEISCVITVGATSIPTKWQIRNTLECWVGQTDGVVCDPEIQRRAAEEELRGKFSDFDCSISVTQETYAGDGDGTGDGDSNSNSGIEPGGTGEGTNDPLVDAEVVNGDTSGVPGNGISLFGMGFFAFSMTTPTVLQAVELFL